MRRLLAAVAAVGLTAAATGCTPIGEAQRMGCNYYGYAWKTGGYCAVPAGGWPTWYQIDACQEWLAPRVVGLTDGDIYRSCLGR